MYFRILILLLSTIASLQLSAQNNFYIGVGVKNHFALNYAQDLDYFSGFTPFYSGYDPRSNFSNRDAFIVPDHLRETDYSLSKGISFNLSAGKQISDQISLETQFQYFTNYNYNRNLYDRISLSWDVNAINFIPSVLLNNKVGEIQMNFYGGLLLGLAKIRHEQELDGEYYRIYETGRSFSLGYTMGLNTTYPLKNQTELYFSIGIQNQFYTPKKGYLKYSKQAEKYDLDPSLYYIKYTNKEFYPITGFNSYGKDPIIDPSNEYQYNIPEQQLVLNSLTIELGIRFTFNKNEDE
ncbi:hypothetical protein [Mangrovivirga cuniculi]|uniref:Outer membrane protein beta-barrel domain-containing protein n=1 Tax=Mangrovivirga cuniculi TaxID=2715131 RepID=A0A4D7JRN1_9BACT|nr:hypothetical protein [Mangrovivirga cuniculi]QCK14466.1 hypothetical protein DCC35_06785 [Mangrovivirga cuniculi]